MTGQVSFVSYDAVGISIAVDLVNALAIEYAFGRPVQRTDPFTAIQTLLKTDPSWPDLRDRDVPGLIALARRIREIFADIDQEKLDPAATQLNELLAAHPAYPQLTREQGRWRLHRHPVDAELVPMATAICAEGVARMIGLGAANRLGTCESDQCERVFLDESKNARRRFCSLACQNRVKAAAFRRRHTADEP